jgi:hypothetical protein
MKSRNNIFNAISSEDAFAILRILADRNPEILKQIEEIANEYLQDILPDEVEEDVFEALEMIEVEEVWDRSGSTRDGYVEPYEMAWEIMDEELEPFLDQMRKYQKLSFEREAKQFCMGILKGIYRFEKESRSEYKEWATDGPREAFESIKQEWIDEDKNGDRTREINEFIQMNCPDWAR